LTDGNIGYRMCYHPYKEVGFTLTI